MNERSRPDEGAAPAITDDAIPTTVTDPADDVHAWAGVFLDDGRVISLAWLRGYAGAFVSRWRRWR